MLDREPAMDRFPWRWLIGLGLLAAGCALAWPLHRLIELPFSNPCDVSGTDFVEHHYAPGNNIARFLYLAAVPSILAIALAVFRALPVPSALPACEAESRRWRWHQVLLVVALGLLVVLVAMGLARPASTTEPIDHFHEGEALGPATELLHGKVSYRDTLFVHGLGQDPGRAIVAFALLGRSIAAVRVLDAGLQSAAFCLLCLFVALVFVRSRAIAAVAICWLMLLAALSVFGLFTHLSLGRDVWTYLWLITCLPLLHPDWRDRFRSIAAFANSLLAVGTLLYSVDRGMFLGATALATTVVLLATGAARRVWIANLCGYGIGAALVAVVLGPGLRDFLFYTFVITPRCKELVDGIVYPFEDYPAWVPVALVAACAMWLTLSLVAKLREKRGVLRGVQDLLREQGLEIILLVFAVAFFRAALGRSEAIHVARGSGPVWLCAVVLAGRQLWPRMLRTQRVKAMLETFCAWSLVALFAAFYLGFRGMPDTRRWRTSTPDAAVMDPSYMEAAAFLRDNLSHDESFYTLTSEATWFYLVDRPCPNRFPVVMFAAAGFYQQELARDLERRKVKYLIYSNDAYWHGLFGAHERRQPILMHAVHRLFEYDRRIGQHVIYRRRVVEP